MLSTRPPSLLKRFLLHTLNPATSTVPSPHLRTSSRPTTQPSSFSTSSAPTSPLLNPSRTFMSSPPTAARTATRIPGPVETSIQTKVIEAFQPELVRISNDSSKHAHHAPMRAVGGGSGETHFALAIVSAAFQGKTQIARHRLVNTLLKDEFDQGLHALSLRLKTPEEWAKENPQ